MSTIILHNGKRPDQELHCVSQKEVKAMNVRVLLMLVLLGFLVLIGCTACNPNRSTTIDLTRDVGVLTTPLGWVAQETYEFADDAGAVTDTLTKLLFVQINTDTCAVALWESSSKQIGSSWFTTSGEDDITFFSPELDTDFIMKVTATEESPPVLSLTKVDSGEKLFFSMGDGE